MKMAQSIETSLYDSPCGQLLLGAYGNTLCLCDWTQSRHHPTLLRRLQNSLGNLTPSENNPIIRQAVTELNEYFGAVRREFTVQLLPIGSPFQKEIWLQLLNIKYGSTISYSHLANEIAHPGACRAVANAVGSNALSIFIPCHRVVGASGSLTGYAGGLDAKRQLLLLEAAKVK